MKLFLSIPILLLFCFTLLPGVLFAQRSSFPEPHQEKTLSLYTNVIGENSSLYKGKVYVGVKKVIKGHQFFETSDWIYGSVVYQGNLYKNVPLLYDLLQDELLIRHPNGFLRIQVQKRELNSFTILKKTFVNFLTSDTADLMAPSGIVERIYEGDISVFVKRQKRVDERIREMTVEREFEQENNFYLLKDGLFYSVKRKSHVFKVLQDRKKIIRKELRKNGIVFRKNPEYALVKIVEYYQSATEQ